MKRILAATLSLVSIAAFAADEPFKAEGMIGAVHVTQDVQDFRVQLENSPALCGNAWTTAYLNAKDQNYTTFVQAVLSAKTSKNKVTLVTKKDTEGYCKLIYLILH